MKSDWYSGLIINAARPHGKGEVMAKFRKKPVVIEAVQALQSECWKEHVPVTGTQHDPANGLIHGYCARCRREWPCEWAPESQAASLPAQRAKLAQGARADIPTRPGGGMMNRYRGTGRTTRQMVNAPKHAVYIWVNNQTAYPRRLASMLDRKDLKIVGPDWLTLGVWRGMELTGVVLDHATELNTDGRDAYSEVRTRVRRKP